MAGANSNIQVTDLDFNNIKSNFITYLQGQDTFKDYNFQGSTLNTLLDIFAYNTQYNAFYLNMVANEMFLDSATQRSSVVSHAKLLNYIPKSSIAPTAKINMTVSGTSGPVTIPAYTNFMSEAINGVNYNFVTIQGNTVNSANGVATFNEILLKQGIVSTQSYTVDSTTNPSYTFEIPDSNVDITSLSVQIQQSLSNTSYQVFTQATDFLGLNGSSQVYFIQESLTGTYEIYFGDGILGQQLNDGNIVNLSYIVTDGSASTGANNFVLMDSITGITPVGTTIFPVVPASAGGDKETIDSIKFTAPKSYSAQNRAVTKDDYITILNQNTLGYQFDAVNVWGGQENNPPVYGQVFVSIKPSGGYSLTTTEKQDIIDNILNPVSIMTVEPVIVEPDYTYIRVNANVLYDPKKTILDPYTLQSNIQSAIVNQLNSTLNTFNSTFNIASLISTIQNVDQSIIANENSIQIAKKIYPNLTTSLNYTLNYAVPLQKGVLTSGIYSYPSMQYLVNNNIVDGVFLEEIPSTTGGIAEIQVLNPGFSYTVAPTVTILGDGTGATAEATIVNGYITNITVTNAGYGYTQAVVQITNATNDSTGQLAAAQAIIESQTGALRTYYNTASTKNILNTNAGTIDYTNVIITLTNFAPYAIDNTLESLLVVATPKTSIIETQQNQILTIDLNDSTSVVVNLVAKQ
jgi:hypothetical protein